MVPHFRHRSGNNDVECEKYLGQYESINTDSRSRKSKSERAEFYYVKNYNMFFLGLRFSDDEIKTYEQPTTYFELRSSVREQAFLSLCIDNRNFEPDDLRMIPLEKFSYDYFLSNTRNGKKRKYKIFNSINRNEGYAPTFFKVQGNDSFNKAKLVRSNILYTNIPYFVAYQDQHLFPKQHSLPTEIKVDDIFQFETMGRKFLGKVLTIEKNTPQIKTLVSSWGYQLDTSETITMLWPPAAFFNEISKVNSNAVFLFSSFKLEAHGNINVHSENIKKITKSVSRILINSKIKIYKKNAEVDIDKEEKKSTGFDPLPIMEGQSGDYTVRDDDTYFLFNRSGVSPINKGQKVLLTPGSLVKHYSSSYLVGLVHPMKQIILSGEQLLNDILAHYKRTEKFSIETFNLFELSEVASLYIEECIKTGLINSAVKHFIKEGQI